MTASIPDCPKLAPINFTAQNAEQSPVEGKEILIARILSSRVMAVVNEQNSNLAKASLYPITDDPCYAQPLSPAELHQLADARPDMARVREIAFAEARKAATNGLMDPMDKRPLAARHNIFDVDWDFIKMRNWLTVTKICEQVTGMAKADDERALVYQEGHRVAYGQIMTTARDLANKGLIYVLNFWLLKAERYAAEINEQTELEHESDELLTLAISSSYSKLASMGNEFQILPACHDFGNMLEGLDAIKRPFINQMKADVVARLRKEIGQEIYGLFLALLDRLDYSIGGSLHMARSEFIQTSRSFDSCRSLLEPLQEEFFANALKEYEATLLLMSDE